MNATLARHLRTLGLERSPFPPTPDAVAWFQTAQRDAELVEAAHALRTRAGFVLLTGEIGTGKSTFLRRLLLALEGEDVVTSMVFNTFLQGPDLLAAVLRDFGLEAQGSPAADLETLNRFLVRQWRAQVTCVLMIDDAQNLSIASLELLRLLTNLETGQEKLLQIVLAGQPELRRNLEQPGIRQLTSRICTHVQLDALAADEVQRYVHYRLAAAGNPGTGIHLPAAAARTLHRASGGNPRRIHQIMDRCLYGLYRQPAGDRRIGPSLVRTAAAQAGARPLRRRWPLALTVALLGVSSIAGAALLLVRPGGDVAARVPAAATAPAAPQAGPSDWERCLRALGTASPALQPVDPAWLERLPSRDGVCLRQQPDGWQAAWRPQLRAADFLTVGGDRARLAAVQALLQAQGHYHGALDGLYGARTRAALAGFQQAHALAASGAPDPATLLLLDQLLAAHTPSSPETHHHGNG